MFSGVLYVPFLAARALPTLRHARLATQTQPSHHKSTFTMQGICVMKTAPQAPTLTQVWLSV